MNTTNINLYKNETSEISIRNTRFEFLYNEIKIKMQNTSNYREKCATVIKIKTEHKNIIRSRQELNISELSS